MTTKETLLDNIQATETIVALIDKINFKRLEDFVKAELFSFVDTRGFDAVHYDLNYDVQTPTDAFILNLLEQGSVQLLTENGLVEDDRFIDALYVIISAINIVVAQFLKKNKIAEVTSYRYFDADPQYVLLERAVEQVAQLRNDNNCQFDLAGCQLVESSGEGSQ